MKPAESQQRANRAYLLQILLQIVVQVNPVSELMGKKQYNIKRVIFQSSNWESTPIL